MGRLKKEIAEQRRLMREPALRGAMQERDRILSELHRIDTFLAVHDEMAAIPPGHA